MRLSLSDATEAAWDVLVVGAGMGGAATAYGLAERGLRVLVIERGHETHSADAPPITDKVDDPDARLAAGRWPDRIGGRLDGHAFDFFAPLGSGVGGSTLLYAAALDRFRACDFAPRTHPDGGTLAWPVAFDEFRHWYAKAETALGVTGSADPLDIHAQTDHLDPPAPLGPRDSDLARRFQAAGLHPYRLHCGFRDGTDCGACLGNLCPSGCKRHAGNRFLAPAQATGRVAVLSEAEVLRFEASETRVEAVTLRVAGETRRLSVPVFVLAAGALVSPALLLRSTGPAWPDGLGNRHDQVGRHLMFHTSRSLAVWSTRAHPHRGPGKSLVLRDFYDTPQGKFGEMQSVGLDASYGYTLYALRQMLEQSRFGQRPLVGRLAHQLARIPALAASLALGRAAIFDLMMEDLPYAHNRVALDPAAPSGLRFDYTITDELRDRFEHYSQAVKTRLRGTRALFLTHGVALNYGHPMGTCRIGRDPAISVADPGGRVHGLDNLYIGDAAFMPTSGGTNPSLTIAAHGLRLAAGIADSHARRGARAAPTPARSTAPADRRIHTFARPPRRSPVGT